MLSATLTGAGGGEEGDGLGVAELEAGAAAGCWKSSFAMLTLGAGLDGGLEEVEAAMVLKVVGATRLDTEVGGAGMAAAAAGLPEPAAESHAFIHPSKPRISFCNNAIADAESDAPADATQSLIQPVNAVTSDCN